MKHECKFMDGICNWCGCPDGMRQKEWKFWNKEIEEMIKRMEGKNGKENHKRMEQNKTKAFE